MRSAFSIVVPSTVEEALADLDRLGPGAHIYAGGVELALLLSSGAVAADHLIDVKRIPGLAGLHWDGDVLTIGATTTHEAVATDPRVRSRLPMLAEAERRVGNIRVRHSGTVGGTLSLAYSHSDLLPPLLVHDAVVVRVTRAGAEQLPLAAMLARAEGAEPELRDVLGGTAERVGARDRVITAVRVPALDEPWRTAYVRAEHLFRPPQLNVAVALRRDDGRIGEARLAVGCVLPHARRLGELERALAGATAAEAAERLAGSGELLHEALALRSDMLGSAAYKAHLAATLLARGVRQALGEEA